MRMKGAVVSKHDVLDVGDGITFAREEDDHGRA